MPSFRVVSREEWLTARKELLRREKELTRLRDELSAARRELPCVQVQKPYVFEGAQGRQSLAELFDGCSQLVVYHFMFGPDWSAGCPSCSFAADHIDGMLPHLRQRDVQVLAVSRAPYPKIAAFKRRMGWRFDWVSSYDTDFNYDFQVSHTPQDIANQKAIYNYEPIRFESEEMPGISVFYKDDSGNVFHTYSSYARGCETLLTTYNVLDLVPKGRDEDTLDFTMAWVRYHDQYETAPSNTRATGLETA
jgi:predicted dithiol-disulfide oxidoreductase (DUF899 family)